MLYNRIRDPLCLLRLARHWALASGHPRVHLARIRALLARPPHTLCDAATSRPKGLRVDLPAGERLANGVQS
jgi:hypothetical protein